MKESLLFSIFSFYKFIISPVRVITGKPACVKLYTGRGAALAMLLCLSFLSPALLRSQWLNGNPFSGGVITRGDKIGITNVDDLQAMNNNLSGSYILMNDIDASETSAWNGGLGFEPVGNASTPFTGLLHGNGFKITGLYINRPKQEDVGLIGSNQGGELIDVAMENINISGLDNVGGLVGQNSEGSITTSYATGSVSGGDNVGGLAGYNYGTITASYATGNVLSVEGHNWTGGLVGYNDGPITGSYATGSVEGSNNAGGLVGLNGSGSIIGSYSTGSVNGESGVGGLVGSNNGIIANSYWNITTSWQATSDGGTGLIDSVFRNQASFTGFDFVSVWNIEEGISYPFLQHNPQDPPPGYKPFPEGDGTSENPYQITNIDQLQIIKNFLDSYFILNNDIDASATSGWNGGTGFEPVGTNSIPFTGSLNGNGFKITGLKIARPEQNYIGLFGYIDVSPGDTVIKNLGLEGADIAGLWFVGGLVGYSHGIITTSYTTGSVSGGDNTGGLAGYNHGTITTSYYNGSVSGVENVGGLVGQNYDGTIIESYAIGSVSGIYKVGGLAGYNFGTITESYSTGSVSGTDIYIGGLVGQNSRTITTSYATGSVTGISIVGGLVGWNPGTITDSYATGSVSGTGGIVNAGGLVGYNDNDGTITTSYAMGSVSGNNVGGLVGSNEGTISDSYWNITTSGQTTSSGGTGLTDNVFRDKASFTGFDFVSVWDIEEHLSYPFLKNNEQVPPPGYSNPFAGGNGTSGNPYQIANVVQLQLMQKILSSHFILINDIDASATDTLNGGLGFEPVGTDSTPFTGLLNGNGFRITGLHINRPEYFNIGLFGVNQGELIDVAMENINVFGLDHVGGLVGFNSGTITTSYAKGSVSGSDVGEYAGGLVGFNGDGTITGSYATGSVSGSDHVGGLVGHNEGTITKSYATGNVSGSNEVGGLVGTENFGQITASYSAGSVSGNSTVGGLVGQNEDGEISDSYWNITTSGQADSDGGTGLADNVFRNQASFTGFDFTTAWEINENHSYPFLHSNPQVPPPGKSDPMGGSHLPTKYALLQNYPNPFNPITKINYEIPAEGLTKLTVYDMSGREVAVLINKLTAPGYHTVEFNGSNFASGVYFYRLVAGSAVISKKMMLIK